MHIQYNTPLYRKLFKERVKRYEECDKVECIEPRVRKICADVMASNLGVSVWSCEGHDDPHHPNAGYIMFMCRNREAAMQLTDVFQRIAGVMIETNGYESGMEIEHDLCTISDINSVQHCYPALTIRNFAGMTDANADAWWATTTGCVATLLKHRIDLQNGLKEIKNASV